MMHIGMVGLGKMGANMRTRLQSQGIKVTGFDHNHQVSDVDSLAALVADLPTPRIVWVMVPAGSATQSVIKELSTLLTADDLVIEGGNSRFTEDQVAAELLSQYGVRYLDCGVSGGIWGKENGYGLMCGGNTEDVDRAMPIFDALRPPGERAHGFVHAGPVGAGHYAKMIHNGIEYGLMQAYAEGFEMLSGSELIDDVPGVLQAWTKGTVVRSWLLDLLVAATRQDADLGDIVGYVNDSGEGRWALEEAINNAVPTPVLAAALFARFASRQSESPAMQAVAALRQQFGGHAVQKRPDNQ